jgi:hypothetical protein
MHHTEIFLLEKIKEQENIIKNLKTALDESNRDRNQELGLKGPELTYMPFGEDKYRYFFSEEFESQKKEPGGDGWLLLISLFGLTAMVIYLLVK